MADRSDYPAAMDPRDQAAAFDFRELWHADVVAQRRRPLAEFLARFPGYERTIAHEWLKLAAPQASEPAIDDPSAAAGEARVGPYRLLRELGRGGQGIVYLAADTRLQHRKVALKVLDGVAFGLVSARRERLRREAEALARLDHPGICGIHDAQLDGDRPHLVMRYIDGRPLQHVLRDNTSMPRDAAALGRVLLLLERTALAVHAAHEAGIVHRDIKPANVMIDLDGRPVLLDFGLARDVDAESMALTMSGEVFGTLAYMAPEQLTGSHDIDRRVDVYALGVLLYECLTLVQPFAVTSRPATTERITAGRYRDLRAVNPAVSRDLAVITATAMEVNRERRYRSARDLADDLANVRERRPITARPASVRLRVWRWTQRHPIAATMLSTLFLALVAVSALFLQLRRQTRELLAWKQANRVVTLAATDPGRALDEATQAATEHAQAEMRSALHSVLAANHQTYELPAMRDVGDLGSALYTPPVLLADGKTIAGVTYGGELVLWNVADGTVKAGFPRAHANRGTAAVLTRDGRNLITGDFGGELAFWNTSVLLAGSATGQRHGTDRRYVACAAGARDVSSIFVGGANGRLERYEFDADGAAALPPTAIPGFGEQLVQQIWPNHDGSLLLVHASAGVSVPEQPRSFTLLDATSGAVRHHESFDTSQQVLAEWNPRGDRFVLLEGPASMRVLGAAGNLLWQAEVGSPVHHAHFTADGARLLSFGLLGLTVRDAETGAILHRQASSTGRSYEDGWLSPDGSLLAAALRDGTLRLIATRDWREIAFLGHTVTGYGRNGFWSADGRLTIFDHTAMLGFAIGFRPWLPSFVGHRSGVVSVAFHPDGQLLASAGERDDVRIWDVRTGTSRELRCEHPAIRVDGSAERVLVATDEAVVRLWPWSAAGAPIELRGHERPVTDASFLADGERVLTIAADRTARIWSAADGTLLRTMTAGTSPLRTFAVDEAHDLLAVGGDTPQVFVFTLSTGQLVRELKGSDLGEHGFAGRPSCLHFDTVNRCLYAAAQHSGGVACWHLADGWRYSLLTGMSAGSTGWAVTDGGGRWLICTENAIGTTRWFDAASHAALPWNPEWEPGTMIKRVQFRGDGEVALLASFDGTVRLFDMQQREPWSTLQTLHGGALDATFSPDGQRVAVGYKDGTVMVWPVDPLPTARAHLVRRSR
jgi:WD40 repeat protein/predicted Ser/Thr protein kinase